MTFTNQKSHQILDPNGNSICGIKDLTIEQVQVGVGLFCRKQKAEFIKSVFEKHARDWNGRFQHVRPTCTSKSLLHPIHLEPALAELGIESEGSKMFKNLFKIEDCGDCVEYKTFCESCRIPMPLEAWTKSLPLSQLLACAIPMTKEADSLTKLRILSQFSDKNIDTLVAGIIEGLKTILSDHILKLRNSFSAMDEKKSISSNSKFQVCKMSCGNIDDFHSSLKGRIGSPHLDFEHGMKLEHCFKAGSSALFQSTNYEIRTCPSKEWSIVVDGAAVCQDDMHHERRIPSVSDLMQNKHAVAANLTRAEVISIVMYTGPMFQIYNSILRQWPAEVFEAFESGNNLFPTTIFVLGSAVQKLSRVVSLPAGSVLYRGLSGKMDLPDSFHMRDGRGTTGFSEWGFMSTTSSKHVALGYSMASAGATGRRGTVLVVHPRSVDRGACIRDFSQYPGEIEYLWAPCSFVEADGPSEFEPTPEGVVEMVPVRINANLKAPTVDELLGQKRLMHVTAFRYLIDEIRSDLERAAGEPAAQARLATDPTRGACDLGKYIGRIVEQCAEVLARHEATEPAEFLDDYTYRRFVLEMAEIKTMAMSKLVGWVSESDPQATIGRQHTKYLRTAHRELITLMETRLPPMGVPGRQAAALEICKVKGLIERSAEERNVLGETRLMTMCAEGGSSRDVALLADAGVDIHRPNVGGYTPTYAAARYGHADCLRVIGGLGARVGERMPNGVTPIFVAAEFGHVECVRVLAELRADLNAACGAGPNAGRTALLVAAMNGRADCLKALVGLGADISRACGDGGESLLSVALASGHTKCVEILEEAADLREQGIGAERLRVLRARFGGEWPKKRSDAHRLGGS